MFMNKKPIKSMNGKWRKLTALLLSGIFFALPVLVELSHQHLERHDHTTRIEQSEGGQADSVRSQNHSFICLACVYGLTQLGPDLTFQTLKPIQESIYLLLRDSTFYNVVLPTSFYLRAPPVSLA